jgi:16S rRNA (guanine966-N2)-methyltransferase
MRIVGGKFRGRSLKGPSSNAIRPTSDRLRESIFNILVHAYADPISDARVLDLFAGTGALGLEAMSRGAEYALFVEEAAEARALIRTNVEALSLTGATKIFRRDAARLGDMGPMEPFDLMFCDPPYGQGLSEKALAAARDGKWLVPSALALVEEAVKAAFKTPEGFDEIERRAYDDTEIVILRAR